MLSSLDVTRVTRVDGEGRTERRYWDFVIDGVPPYRTRIQCDAAIPFDDATGVHPGDGELLISVSALRSIPHERLATPMR
jgi:hypothetical protein